MCLSDSYINSDDFTTDITNLKAKDRLGIVTDLLPFAVPKLQNPSLEAGDESEQSFMDELARLAGE